MRTILCALFLLVAATANAADTATVTSFRLSTGKGTDGALNWRCDYVVQFKPSGPRGYRPWLEFECVLVSPAGGFDRQSGLAFPWLPDENGVVDFAKVRLAASGKADGRWSGHDGKKIAAYRAVIMQRQPDESVTVIGAGPSVVAPGFERKIPNGWWDRAKFTTDMLPIPEKKPGK